MVYSPSTPKATLDECEACARTSLHPVSAVHNQSNGGSLKVASSPGGNQLGNSYVKFKDPLQPVMELEDYRNNVENSAKERGEVVSL